MTNFNEREAAVPQILAFYAAEFAEKRRVEENKAASTERRENMLDSGRLWTDDKGKSVLPNVQMKTNSSVECDYEEALRWMTSVKERSEAKELTALIKTMPDGEGRDAAIAKRDALVLGATRRLTATALCLTISKEAIFAIVMQADVDPSLLALLAVNTSAWNAAMVNGATGKGGYALMDGVPPAKVEFKKSITVTEIAAVPSESDIRKALGLPEQTTAPVITEEGF